MRDGASVLVLAVVLASMAFGLSDLAIADPQITSFPDGDATSGRFVNLTNKLESLGEAGTTFCVEVPTDLTGNQFVLQIFDGEYSGLWDLKGVGQPEVLYQLISDPEQDGDKTPGTVVAQWSSTQMTNNGWFTCTSDNSTVGSATSTTGVENSSLAEDTSDGVYRYSLVVKWKTAPTGNAMNCFKVRVQGQIFGLKESRYGFVGFKWGAAFYGGGFPWTWDNDTLTFKDVQDPITTYDGTWSFDLDIDKAATVIDFWNGDFDVADDDNDTTTTGTPSWAPSPPAQNEGKNSGDPSDDLTYEDIDGNVLVHPYQITTSVAGIYQEVSDPSRSWTYQETNPSGNREWEDFQIAVTGFGKNPDFTVSSLPAGRYHWEIFGVDAQNTLFLRPQYNLFPSFGDHSIGDRIWLDMDNSGGVDDDGEPGINDVTVKLYLKIAGQYVLYDTTTTDRVPDPNNVGEFIDGYYVFENLAPGDYKVVVESTSLPVGLTQTYDLDGTSTANEALVTISDADNLALDFSYYGSGTIGDFVWLDANGNRQQDDGAGSGLPNVDVELWIDWEDDGTFILLAEDTTDASGNYLFSGLPVGTYEVKVVDTTLPSGLSASFDPDGGLPNEAGLPLGVSETNLKQDFGYKQTDCRKGSIGDTVWLDSDGDGRFDSDRVAGELPISGVCVLLCGDTDGDGKVDIRRATKTNCRGKYLFDKLPKGRYCVKITSANFTRCGALYGMKQTYDYDRCLDNKTCISLDCGENFLNADFGYRPKCPPGTGTPGYWKNHASAWPVSAIRIGGRNYTKAQAIRLMKKSGRGDKTYDLFRHLVSAKLNVGVGNDYGCAETAIKAADRWMATYPVGSCVKASSRAWKNIEWAYTKLDSYNNGKLECAYSRDERRCDCHGSDGQEPKQRKSRWKRR